METKASRVAPAVSTVRVRRGEEGAFAVWLTELKETVASFPGYISAVVIPPVPPLQSDWVMVQRFQTIQQFWEPGSIRTHVARYWPRVPHCSWTKARPT